MSTTRSHFRPLLLHIRSLLLHIRSLLLHIRSLLLHIRSLLTLDADSDVNCKDFLERCRPHVDGEKAFESGWEYKVCCQCVANVLRVCCQCVANVLGV